MGRWKIWTAILTVCLMASCGETKEDVEGKYRTEADVYYLIGMDRFSERDYTGAALFFKESLKLANSVLDFKRAFNSASSLGAVYLKMGDYSNAVSNLITALNLSSNLNREDEHFLESKGMVLNNLGLAYIKLGDLTNAEKVLTEAEKIAREVDNDNLTMLVKNNLGLLNFSLGRVDKAIELWNEALETAKSLENYSMMATINVNLARAFLEKGDVKTAEEFALSALNYDSRVENPQGIFKDLVLLAKISHIKGDEKKADYYFSEALKVAKSCGMDVDENELKKRCFSK